MMINLANKLLSNVTLRNTFVSLRHLSTSKDSDQKNLGEDKTIVSNETKVKANNLESKKEETEIETKLKDDDNKYVIIGPDGVPYDPSKDPEYTNDFHQYRYPQYFTQHLGPKRVLKIIKEDVSLWKKGRIHKTREELGCPKHVDVCILGGGIIGSSVAYFVKNKAPFSLSCAVIERDPTYTRASTTLSTGGLRLQWNHAENILMSMFGADFLRDAKRNLSILDGEPPDVSFTPQGFLTLATEEQAEKMIENHKIQIELGALVELYTAERIKQKFPHINTNGIVLGSYGVQNEGWFDPWALLLSTKAKANSLGAEFVHADVIDFNFRRQNGNLDEMDEIRDTCNYVIVREPDGSVKQIEFAFGVICCGPDSGFIAEKLGYGHRGGVRSIPFPVEARKRYVYTLNSKDGPGLDFPFLIDPSGVYCRREGLGGNFLCGRSPMPEDEPDGSNLDVDYNYFESAIRPHLVKRVPSFESAKVRGGWSGFYDHCRHDQNPIIGYDPYYQNLIWATGFGGRGLQMGPAIGRAVMEMIIYGNYKTIDLSRYSWNRIIQNRALSQELIT